MDLGIAGKVALVTGAGQGIGRASALAFAREGARVVVADLNEGTAKETVALVEQVGAEAAAVAVDVSDEPQAEAMVAFAVERFGRLDLVHNNAGIDQHFMPTSDMSRAEWDRIFAINVTGMFLCLKYELPVMVANGGGAIVNTASTAGLGSGPGLQGYVSSKYSVIGLTRSVAMEHAANGIRANAVCPGATNTPMVADFMRQSDEVKRWALSLYPLGRFAEPEEIADAVVWLCSDHASFITGIALPIDGGQTTK